MRQHLGDAARSVFTAPAAWSRNVTSVLRGDQNDLRQRYPAPCSAVPLDRA